MIFGTLDIYFSSRLLVKNKHERQMLTLSLVASLQDIFLSFKVKTIKTLVTKYKLYKFWFFKICQNKHANTNLSFVANVQSVVTKVDISSNCILWSVCLQVNYCQCKGTSVKVCMFVQL